METQVDPDKHGADEHPVVKVSSQFLPVNPVSKGNSNKTYVYSQAQSNMLAIEI